MLKLNLPPQFSNLQFHPSPTTCSTQLPPVPCSKPGHPSHSSKVSIHPCILSMDTPPCILNTAKQSHVKDASREFVQLFKSEEIFKEIFQKIFKKTIISIIFKTKFTLKSQPYELYVVMFNCCVKRRRRNLTLLRYEEELI